MYDGFQRLSIVSREQGPGRCVNRRSAGGHGLGTTEWYQPSSRGSRRLLTSWGVSLKCWLAAFVSSTAVRGSEISSVRSGVMFSGGVGIPARPFGACGGSRGGGTAIGKLFGGSSSSKIEPRVLSPFLLLEAKRLQGTINFIQALMLVAGFEPIVDTGWDGEVVAVHTATTWRL